MGSGTSDDDVKFIAGSSIPVSELFSSEHAGDAGYDDRLFEIYKLCVEMADRVSARRQSANNFYLSINTLIVGALFAGRSADISSSVTFTLLAAAGLSICVMWRRSIHSYKGLNSGKFAIINTIERRLVARPFSSEWKVLERGENIARYRPFNHIEAAIPLIFGLLFAVSLMSLVDQELWLALWETLVQATSTWSVGPRTDAPGSGG